MFFTSEPEALRAFFRDKLGFTGTDVGEGWLIFDVPEADLGCHPSEPPNASGACHASFYCDDLKKTVSELKGRGVEFTGEVRETEWGFLTSFRVPGNFEIGLYQPKYRK